MIRSVKSLSGAPLVYRQKPFDTISKILFCPETGKVRGILGKKGDFFPFSEILFSEKEIGIHKQKRREKTGENLLQYAVHSTHGEDLGEVTDVEFDTEFGILKRILVTKSVFSLPFSRKIFPYERIVNIRKKVILVDDDATEKKVQKEFCPA